MKGIFSILAAMGLVISTGPALAITVGLPAAVIEETSGVTQLSSAELLGLPTSRLPARVDKRLGTSPEAAIPAQQLLSVPQQLPSALRRLLPAVAHPVDLGGPARPLPAGKAGGVASSTQLEVFGAELGGLAADRAKSEAVSASTVLGVISRGTDRRAGAKTARRRAKRWVPERVLPGATQVLAGPVQSRW